MSRYGRAAALVIGVVLLIISVTSPTAFNQFYPIPSCQITSVSIEGPSEAAVGTSLTFKGVVSWQAGTGSKCARFDLTYNWSLKAAPQGADSWSVTGQEVSFTPKVVGEHTLRLEIVGAPQPKSPELVVGSAEHKLMVAGGATQPPSQPPSQPQPSTGIQEFALILAPSGGALHTFPATLRVSAGGLRLFMASLDRTITVVLRREGAQAGVATVLVEQGKIATVEAELSQATYGLFDQASNSQLGQIEAR